MIIRAGASAPYAGPVLLALDTSTDVVTVAVHDGTRLVGHAMGSGVRRHAEMLAPLVSQVLGQAGVEGGNLERIAVGVGPGAYTGLRVGLVTAQTLALTWSAPVSGACSLDAVAVQAWHEDAERMRDGLLVVTDARRGQVFWARYTAQARRVAGPAVGAVETVPARHLPAVGSGALAHPHLFHDVSEPAGPDAAWLARGLLDARISGVPARAMYLREPDVTIAGGAKPVLQPGSIR